MAKKRYQVMVDQWGSNPVFDRGRVLELDLDDDDAMAGFPYDARYALENGVLLDLEADAERMKGQREEQDRADREAQALIDGASRPPTRTETVPAAPARPSTGATRPTRSTEPHPAPPADPDTAKS